jgi:myo-inositol-1(or 4)-monophosphatase
MNRIDAMKQAALEAGAYLVGNPSDGSRTQKTGAKDFVTAADIKTQDILRQELLAVMPGSLVLSEEDSEDDRAQLYAPDFTGFVIDPIDGTYNYAHNMQESAISIGYIERGQPVAGVIYDPYKKELFTAEIGKGSFCNDQPIQVSGQQNLAGASVATSNGYDDAAASRSLQRQVAIYEQSGIMPWTSCPGSAVLVLAWIAGGRVDAIHHTGFKPWDNAAGMLLVREAGGIVHTLQGQEATFTDAKLVA